MVGSCLRIVKEYLKPEEFDDAPRREFDALQLMELLDIAPCPLCRAQATEEHGPLVIYEFMAGQMWDRYCPQPHEFQELVDLWLTMHSVTHDKLWFSRNYDQPLGEAAGRMEAILTSYAEWTVSEFHAGQQAAERCLSLVESRQAVLQDLSAYDPPLLFCRSDPRFANVVRRPDGRLGMVDWEDSGLRDPARDLADLMTHPNQEDLVSRKQWQALLQPYERAIGSDDPELLERVHLYEALFPLFWLTILINAGMRRTQQGKLDGWDANGLPASVRLRRCLARGLAWPRPHFMAELARVEDLCFFPLVDKMSAIG